MRGMPGGAIHFTMHGKPACRDEDGEATGHGEPGVAPADNHHPVFRGRQPLHLSVTPRKLFW